MTIERTKRRASRRLLGDREGIEVLEARQLLSGKSGAIAGSLHPNVTLPTQTGLATPIPANPFGSKGHRSILPLGMKALARRMTANPSYPMVNEAYATDQHGRLTAFVISFSHDMAPGPATDLKNYQVTETFSHPSSRSVSVPLCAATYDPAHRSVTLVPAQPTRVGHFLIEGKGDQGKTALTDVQGVPIDDGQGGPAPDAQLIANIKPHGHWFGPLRAEQVAMNAAVNDALKHRPIKLGI
jgi:hypothetical protein